MTDRAVDVILLGRDQKTFEHVHELVRFCGSKWTLSWQRPALAAPHWQAQSRRLLIIDDAVPLHTALQMNAEAMVVLGQHVPAALRTFRGEIRAVPMRQLDQAAFGPLVDALLPQAIWKRAVSGIRVRVRATTAPSTGSGSQDLR